MREAQSQRVVVEMDKASFFSSYGVVTCDDGNVHTPPPPPSRFFFMPKSVEAYTCTDTCACSLLLVFLTLVWMPEACKIAAAVECNAIGVEQR